MKAHKFTVLVVDHENYGVDEFVTMIEQIRGMSAEVIDALSADIGEWSDDHPLNDRNTMLQEMARLEWK